MYCTFLHSHDSWFLMFNTHILRFYNRFFHQVHIFPIWIFSSYSIRCSISRVMVNLCEHPLPVVPFCHHISETDHSTILTCWRTENEMIWGLLKRNDYKNSNRQMFSIAWSLQAYVQRCNVGARVCTCRSCVSSRKSNEHNDSTNLGRYTRAFAIYDPRHERIRRQSIWRRRDRTRIIAWLTDVAGAVTRVTAIEHTPWIPNRRRCRAVNLAEVNWDCGIRHGSDVDLHPLSSSAVEAIGRPSGPRRAVVAGLVGHRLQTKSRTPVPTVLANQHLHKRPAQRNLGRKEGLARHVEVVDWAAATPRFELVPGARHVLAVTTVCVVVKMSRAHALDSVETRQEFGWQWWRWRDSIVQGRIIRIHYHPLPGQECGVELNHQGWAWVC